MDEVVSREKQQPAEMYGDGRGKFHSLGATGICFWVTLGREEALNCNEVRSFRMDGKTA